MPKDLVGQLRGWQEAARVADERLNPQLTVDPAVVAAKEKALREARKKKAGARVSRSKVRKTEFLAREREKARQQALKEFQALSRDERLSRYGKFAGGLSNLAELWGGRFFPYTQ